MSLINLSFYPRHPGSVLLSMSHLDMLVAYPGVDSMNSQSVYPRALDSLLTFLQVVKADGLTLPPINGGMGRSLKVNPAWKNPSGDWHVGAIRAYRLFPGGAIRKSKEGRARAWAAKQRAAISTATAAVATHSRMNPDPLDGDLKKERAELEARVKLLEELEGAREDLGPLIECVVWHDGTTWRAALDTSDMYQIDAEGEVGDSDATGLFPMGLTMGFLPTVCRFPPCREPRVWVKRSANICLSWRGQFECSKNWKLPNRWWWVRGEGEVPSSACPSPGSQAPHCPSSISPNHRRIQRPPGRL